MMQSHPHLDAAYNLPLIRELIKSYAGASRSLTGPGFPSLPWWQGPNTLLNADALAKLEAFRKYRYETEGHAATAGLFDASKFGFNNKPLLVGPPTPAHHSAEARKHFFPPPPPPPHHPPSTQLPAQLSVGVGGGLLPVPTPRIPQSDFRIPLTIAPENGVKLSTTLLAGQVITCFDIGGEKRLCLPQILSRILPGFGLEELHEACKKLHIYCSRCTQEQMRIFRSAGIIDPTAASCGLITKTDAERLCTALLPPRPEKGSQQPSTESFKVYHECFGKCKGIFMPELYMSPETSCIMCVQCECLFSPRRFIVHSHDSGETQTCHWGFDSANWRAYLLLAKDQPRLGHLHTVLEQIKHRFTKRKSTDDVSPSVNHSKTTSVAENHSAEGPGFDDTSPSSSKRQRIDSATSEGDANDDNPDYWRRIKHLPPKKSVLSAGAKLQTDIADSKGSASGRASESPPSISTKAPLARDENNTSSSLSSSSYCSGSTSFTSSTSTTTSTSGANGASGNVSRAPPNLYLVPAHTTSASTRTDAVVDGTGSASNTSLLKAERAQSMPPQLESVLASSSCCSPQPPPLQTEEYQSKDITSLTPTSQESKASALRAPNDVGVALETTADPDSVLIEDEKVLVCLLNRLAEQHDESNRAKLVQEIISWHRSKAIGWHRVNAQLKVANEMLRSQVEALKDDMANSNSRHAHELVSTKSFYKKEIQRYELQMIQLALLAQKQHQQQADFSFATTTLSPNGDSKSTSDMSNLSKTFPAADCFVANGDAKTPTSSLAHYRSDDDRTTPPATGEDNLENISSESSINGETASGLLPVTKVDCDADQNRSTSVVEHNDSSKHLELNNNSNNTAVSVADNTEQTVRPGSSSDTLLAASNCQNSGLASRLEITA